MRISLSSDEVGQIVMQTFDGFGVKVQTIWDLEQTILIDDGQYRGRSYRCAGLMAMWLAEIGLLQFYDAAGNMLRTINLFEETVPERMAA